MRNLLFVGLILFSSLGFSSELKCVGTEPFWGANLSMDSGALKVTLPGSESDLQVKLNIQGALGASKEYAFMGTSESFIVSAVKTDSCSDGMSDNTYPYQVLVTAKNIMGQWQAPLVGCCK